MTSKLAETSVLKSRLSVPYGANLIFQQPRQGTSTELKLFVVLPLCHKCSKCDVVRSQPAVRVAITEQAAALDDGNADDGEYEDLEENDRSDSAILLDSQAVADVGSCNLSMIMEQSFVDADFSFCMSGIHCDSDFVVMLY